MAARLILSLVFCVMLGLSAQAQPLTVFAAASLKTALDKIADQFHTQTGHVVQISYAGSSSLARQIQYGAPADVFISANPDWMDVLQNDGLLRAGTRLDLLTNTLVLIAAPNVDAKLQIAPGFGLADALDGAWLAMALVNAVPVGVYGKSALQSLGVWDAVQANVAQSDNARTTLMLVAKGEARFGIVYGTDAAAEPSVRIVDQFPADSHPPILYPAAIVKDSTAAGAASFLDYLSSPAAMSVFTQNGFGIPQATP